MSGQDPSKQNISGQHPLRQRAEVRKLDHTLDWAAARLLTAAFLDDPVWRATGPRRLWHRRLVLVAFHFMELRLVRRRGGWVLGAFNSDYLAGVIAAYPRGEAPTPWWAWLPRAVPLLIAGPVPTVRAIQVANGLERIHPRHPHVHFWLVGADGDARGIGVLLMRTVLARAAELQRSSYLEATAPHLVTLYMLLGFEVVGSYRLRTGADVTTMWRELVGQGDQTSVAQPSSTHSSSTNVEG